MKNTEFLSNIGGVDIITFADPYFHFSYNNYAKKFRDDLVECVKKYKVFVVIPDYTFPLMYEQIPEIRNYLIGMKTNLKKVKIPTKENFVEVFDDILSFSASCLNVNNGHPNYWYRWRNA